MEYRLAPYKDRVVIEVAEHDFDPYHSGIVWRPMTITEAMNLTIVVKIIEEDSAK